MERNVGKTLIIVEEHAPSVCALPQGDGGGGVEFLNTYSTLAVECLLYAVVRVYLSVARACIPCGSGAGVRVAAGGFLDDVQHVFVGKLGIGFKPKSHHAGHHRACHRRAAHHAVVKLLAVVVGHYVGNGKLGSGEASACLGKSTLYAAAGSCHSGLNRVAELRPRAGELAHLPFHADGCLIAVRAVVNSGSEVGVAVVRPHGNALSGGSSALAAKVGIVAGYGLYARHCGELLRVVDVVDPRVGTLSRVARHFHHKHVGIGKPHHAGKIGGCAEDGDVLLVVVRRNAIGIGEAGTAELRVCGIFLCHGTAHAPYKHGAHGEVRRAVVSLSPYLHSHHAGGVVRAGFRVEVFRSFALGKIGLGMQELPALVAHCANEDAALAAQCRHTLIVGGGSVMRTGVSAEAHIDYPRLSLLFGETLYGFRLRKHYGRAEVGGSHDNVSLVSDAVKVVPRHFAAGGNIGDMRAVPHARAAAAARGGYGGSKFVVAPKGFHAVFKGDVVILEELVDYAHHYALARKGRFEQRALMYAGSLYFATRRAEHGVELRRSVYIKHVFAGSERGNVAHGHTRRDKVGGDDGSFISAARYAGCDSFRVSHAYSDVEHTVCLGCSAHAIGGAAGCAGFDKLRNLAVPFRARLVQHDLCKRGQGHQGAGSGQ